VKPRGAQRARCRGEERPTKKGADEIDSGRTGDRRVCLLKT